MSVLNKIKLAHSPLTDSIYLYRHGKDPALALEKRDAEAAVMAVLVEHMMHETTRGSRKVITIGDRKFEIIVRPIDAAKGEE